MRIRSLLFMTIVSCAFCFGQSADADIVRFILEGRAGFGLLPGNETGNVNSNGSGDVLTGILFDTDTRELSIDVGWGSDNGFTDMTGDATAMHIHGPADFDSNAPVLIPLSGLPGYDPSATGGGFTGTVVVDAGNVQFLLDGLTYINVHTVQHGPGELRGNLVLVPEPSSAIIGLLGAAILVRRRR